MLQDEDTSNTLEKYRNDEIQLHHELMNVCRKYISRVSIVSVLGILEIVKQESIELEQATRENTASEKPESDFKI